MTSISRWQLNRAGIVNVYQYENEVLHFRGGRLLLRGINGSGKSTAMNMLLPFLLTGKTRGIDAAGEQTGVLKSWMLSGRDEKQPVGYLWLEFSRRVNQTQLGDEPAGGAKEHPETPSESIEYLAVGCGIKASRASDSVNTWWFVTSLRPGIDFPLVEQKVPLSVDSLRIALDPDPVFAMDRRADYRQEIQRRLYGGAPIDSFLEIINTVRNPRVGDRVDLELPAYLVAALPNLSEASLVEAARPLDDLDEHRRNVGDLDATATGLAGITDIYHLYVLTELQREMQLAQDALKSMRRASRELQQAQHALEQTVQAQAQASEHLSLLKESVESLEQQIQALQRSSAYTEGQQLEDLRHHVTNLEQALTQAQVELDVRQTRVSEHIKSVIEAEHQTDEHWQAFSEQLTLLSRDIQEVGVASRTPSLVTVPRVALHGAEGANEPMQMQNDSTTMESLTTLASAAGMRQLDLNTAREQLGRFKLAETGLRDARAAKDNAEHNVLASDRRFQEGRQALEQQRETWFALILAWQQEASASHTTSQATDLKLDHHPLSTELLIDLQSQQPAEPHDIHALLDKGIGDAVDGQQRLVIAQEARVSDATEAHRLAQQELDRLMLLSEPEIPRLLWQQRDGPSFAELVDFSDELTPTQCARLEAALEASGLLYATIEAEGVRLRNGELLVVAGPAVLQPLSTVLQVSIPDAATHSINEKQVALLLNSISVDIGSDCATIISTDGEFRLGVLSGKHDKTVAEYVGAGARRDQLERLRRAAASEVETLSTVLNDTHAILENLRQLYQTRVALKQQLPDLKEFDLAQAVAIAREQELNVARERLEERLHNFIEAEQRLSVVDDECQRVCRTLKLPADDQALHVVENRLATIRADIQRAVQSYTMLDRLCTQWQRAVEHFQQAQQDLVQATQRFDDSRSRFMAERSKLETLEATLGSSYREVVEMITVHQRNATDARSQIPSATLRANDTIRQNEAAKNLLSNAAGAEQLASSRCVELHRHLRRVVEVPGLLAAANALPHSPESRYDAQPPDKHIIASTSDDADGLSVLLANLRTQVPSKQIDPTRADGVRQSLRQRRNMLGAGWDAEDHQPDPSLPMSIGVIGPLGEMPLAESLVVVRTQLSQLRALLSEKQDQALRNLLQGLIAREVAEKMHEANRLIQRMNDRLKTVTSSHGIGVKLRWRQSQELDTTVSDTVEILAKRPDLRSEAEEQQLRSSLAHSLEEARRMAPDAPYRDLIATVFDYRSWHEMAILLRRGDEPMKRLTRRTPLSEGEKKLVSYLPLFAAVAASCDALADAGGHGVPRFLLLDDAFAKVSEDNHAALFGLLVSLELDFIATSERLWGTHASVPSLSITEVVRDTSLGAILLEHSTWDGHTLQMMTNDVPENYERPDTDLLTRRTDSGMSYDDELLPL